MNETLRVSVVQMNATTDIAENLATIGGWIERLAGEGSELVCLPENATQLAPEAQRLASAEPLDGRQVSELREACARHGVALLLGSMAESGPDPGHTFNTSLLVDRAGELVAVYRKIHLFDVTVASDTTFRESDTVAPGPPEPVVAELAGWKLGLSICYDLRFPELYRALVAAGAEVLAVPAAFTFRTGAAHWHTLLRARAIENQCYVLAPAQVGRHYGSRESYGHALVVSPWGEVVAEVDGGPGAVSCELRRSRIEEVRAAIPCLSSRRL